MAGNETVGRRGGAQQRGGNGRENSSDLSSSTSKKKQKDRANQESREAKKAAAAAADGVIAEVKKGKRDSTCSKKTIVTTKVTAMCSHYECIMLVSLQNKELHCSYTTLVLYCLHILTFFFNHCCIWTMI